MSWREIPFVRLIIPLILGIVLQDFFVFYWSPLFSAAILVAFLIIALFLSWDKRPYFQRFYFGGFSSVGLVFIGSLLYFLHSDTNQPLHFSTISNKEVQLEGEILRTQTKNKYTRLILKIEKAHFSDQSIQLCQGRLLTYLPIDAHTIELQRGDHIIIPHKVFPITESRNPYAFNFQRYWQLKNTRYQSFPKEGEWVKTGTVAPFSLFSESLLIRKQLLDILHEHLPTINEFSVGASLILGEKSDLSPEIRTAYSETGSMHVLAVSGLHTGLVFLFVNFILGLLPVKKRYWKWTKTIMIILALWSFALLTGASPSVMRSASMFSFIIIGATLNRASNIYNTLAASAFCLLIIRPTLFFEPGFQLSYLAVIGIVYFQAKIYKIWYIKNKLGDYFWKLVSISIAAQLTTLPLSLFYFHQFPLYFWLSGLVVIPAAIIILPLGFSLFVFHSVPFIGWAIGKVLFGVIWTLNALIFYINNLPLGLIHGIWIGMGILLLLYFVIVSLVGFLETKRARWVIIGLLTLNVILATNVLDVWQSLHQEKIIIYHLSKSTLLDFVDKNNVITLTSGDFDNKKEVYAAANNREFLRIKEQSYHQISETAINQKNFHKEGNQLQFKDFQLIILQKRFPAPDTKMMTQSLLITDNSIHSIDELFRYFDFENIIFDGSNYRSNTKKWMEECKALGIDCIDTWESGAYIIK